VAFGHIFSAMALKQGRKLLLDFEELDVRV
jgi:hypothetical protein